MSKHAGESRAATLIREVFESGRPLTYIRSTEEFRIAKVLREVAGRMPGDAPAQVWTWSLTEGMHRDGEAALSKGRWRRAPRWISSRRIASRRSST